MVHNRMQVHRGVLGSHGQGRAVLKSILSHAQPKLEPCSPFRALRGQDLAAVMAGCLSAADQGEAVSYERARKQAGGLGNCETVNRKQSCSQPPHPRFKLCEQAYIP